MAYSLGFKSKSNLGYYTFFTTVMLAFVAFNARNVFIKSVYCNPFTSDGATFECYWFMKPDSRHYWAIQIHLLTCLPAMALATTQFIPAIRQKYPVVHRWVGRTCVVLGPLATFSGLALGETAFGATFATVSGSAVLGTMSLVGHYQAWIAIRERKIHKHRKWMIRTWVWLGTVVTMRPLLVLGAIGLTWYKNNYSASFESPMLCERLVHMSAINTEPDFAPINVFRQYAAECLLPGITAGNLAHLQNLFDLQIQNRTDTINPAILSALRHGAVAMVPAGFDRQRLDTTTAMVDIAFGRALWVALVAHVVLVELYLRSSQAEHDRLKRVSDRLRKPHSKPEQEKTTR